MAENILVAVFSASGVTRRVGEEIARIAGADFYEIVPKEIYTSADLNWLNKRSRSSVEMNDPSARPKIAGKVLDMASYDTVIVGFPIWWGVAPRIIDTFLESYDFSGKKIIPFCTSGGSGVGRSDTALHKDVSGDVKRKHPLRKQRQDSRARRRFRRLDQRSLLRTFPLPAPRRATRKSPLRTPAATCTRSFRRSRIQTLI